jgi:hypothetical protein
MKFILALIGSAAAVSLTQDADTTSAWENFAGADGILD